MSFSVPEFNLKCDIYSGPYDTRVLRLHDVPCNLALGRRNIATFHDPGGLGFGAACASLLLPAGTDIRTTSQMGPGVGVYDIVEVTPGSRRWYVVIDVDDAGKGFPNEYRFAWLAQLSSNAGLANTTGLFWSVPMP